jgi:hypothetical protein
MIIIVLSGGLDAPVDQTWPSLPGINHSDRRLRAFRERLRVQRPSFMKPMYLPDTQASENEGSEAERGEQQYAGRDAHRGGLVFAKSARCAAAGRLYTKANVIGSAAMRVLCPLLLFFVVFPPRSFAQQPPPGLVEVKEGTRRGVWFGLAVGAGGESNDAFGPGYTDPFYKPTVSLRAGGTVGSHLRLGGEVLSWFDEQGDAVASLSSLMFVAQLYPLSTTGLYLKGGLGIGRNAIDFDGGFDVGDTGFAGLVGAGYELRLGRRLYLNPNVDLVGHSYSGRVGNGYSERLINFGLGVLFQSGK